MRKRHHVNPRFRIWPECEEIEPDVKRGDLRLLGEMLIAVERGCTVPDIVTQRVGATIHAVAGAST